MARAREGNGTLRCSFCGKSQREVKKLIAGPTVYICDECIELCNDIIAEEYGQDEAPTPSSRVPKPREIKEALDEYVIGQERAKKILAVAVHNHYRRIESQTFVGEVELQKANILLLGPTGSGKTLLKLTEGTMGGGPPRAARRHPQQEFLQVDTSNILFLCGGAFCDLETIIERRIGVKGMGFNANIPGRAKRTQGEWLHEVQAEDLLKFGLIPEFVGRLPVIATLTELGEDALVDILTEPKNALVKQYQKLFEFEDVRLRFSDGALRAVARQALGRRSGARGLRSILENVMLDLMYDIPSRDDVEECVISEEVIEQGSKPLLVLKQEAESA